MSTGSSDETTGPSDAARGESTQRDQDGPDVAHQAKFDFDGSGDGEEADPITTEGVVTETDLGDWGADVSDPEAEKETRLARPEASEFGVDDRPERESQDDGEQANLVTDVDEGQQTLDGDDATGKFLFRESTVADSGSDAGEADQSVATDGGAESEHLSQEYEIEMAQETKSEVVVADNRNQEWVFDREGPVVYDPELIQQSESYSVLDIADMPDEVVELLFDAGYRIVNIAGAVRTRPGGNDSEGQPSSEDSAGSGEAESKSFYGLGAGRRNILHEIEQQGRLNDVEDPETLNEIIEAVRKIHLESYSSPPEEVIKTIETVHDRLPDEAKPHFVEDEVLLRRVNAARDQFNDAIGKIKRSKEIPSPVEAGPANYPAEKAKKRSRYAREGWDELQERLDKIESGARGARQRALEAIGSSVKEQNESRREDERDSMREVLEEGDLVEFRNPTLHIGRVIRVNKKSVRVEYPNPRAGETKAFSDESEPDYRETRVQLDSDFLEVLTEDALGDHPVDATSVVEAEKSLF